MRFDLTTPCAQCPFRRDVPGFLHRERAAEIADSMLLADELFPCHKTVHWSDEDAEGEAVVIRHPGEQACAGALLFCLRHHRLPQVARIAERLGLFNADLLYGDVFSSRAEFLAHMEDV